MKHIMTGFLVIVFGYFFLAICLNIFNAGNNNDIVFSILYLCAIVGISTSLILDKISKNNDK